MILKGFENCKGTNCEASVMRNVLKYYGSEYSEELLFGMDSNIGFMYLRAKSDKPDMVLGKCEIFTRRSLNYLGVKCKEISSLTGVQGWKKIKEEYIDKSIPVIARVDMSLLPYWNLPEEASFGGYFVIICGYEEDSQMVYVADSEYDEIQKISIEDLSRARASRNCAPINPGNMLFVLEQVTKEPNLCNIGIVAIKQVVRNFLVSASGNMGLKGMKTFAKDIQNWGNIKTGTIKETYADGSIIEMPTVNFQMKQVGRYINGVGTGEGFYRYIFSRYMNEMYNITNKSEFEEVFPMFVESADIWKKVGNCFFVDIDNKSINEVNDILGWSSEQCFKIVDIEDKAFNILRKVR